MAVSDQGYNDKPLVRWMKEGDPDLAPVMMSDARSTTASYFGLTGRGGAVEPAITTDMVLQCHAETGMSFAIGLGDTHYVSIVPFLDGFSLSIREEQTQEGMLKHTIIATPAGDLTETYITPHERPGCWVKHYVEGDHDLPAFTRLIEEAAHAVLHDPRVRESITAGFRANAGKWPSFVPFYAVIGIPAFRFMSNEWMNPTDAFYTLHDHRAVFERVFDAEMRVLPVLVKCAADAGADFILHAINGLELYSKSIYDDYFIPQARTLHELVHEQGMLAWVHTCGHLRQLIEMNVHHDMGADILESLSHPPLGDVIDLKASRRRLGSRIVTRGAVNVSLFYETDVEEVRRRARLALDEVRGYRHMIGDTNSSYPPYPRYSIMALVDEVRASGRMFVSPG